MAPLFWYKISDWRKESVCVNFTKPLIALCYSTEFKDEQIKTTNHSLKSLKYFDYEVISDVYKMQMKVIDAVHRLESSFIEYDPCTLYNNYIRSLVFPKGSIIASRSIISRIMNTPFEINRDKRKWIIKAELIKDNCIQLYIEDDNDDNLRKKIEKQYELLKLSMFVNTPNRDQYKSISPFQELFGEILGFKLGANKLLFYTADIPGVISEEEITELQKLIESDHIHCDVLQSNEFTEEVNNYNPVSWSNAVLINAKNCFIGSYDKENDCLKEIIKFDIDKFKDKTKYKNLWSPDAAWNFLDGFLNFVINSVDCVKNDNAENCIWTFQSLLNDNMVTSYVTCEILLRSMKDGREILTPLSVNNLV